MLHMLMPSPTVSSQFSPGSYSIHYSQGNLSQAVGIEDMTKMITLIRLLCLWKVVHFKRPLLSENFKDSLLSEKKGDIQLEYYVHLRGGSQTVKRFLSLGVFTIISN